MNKLVTVITPCHNAGDTIAQTIDSVLAQTYPNWEMIVVDDGSTDNSAEIIQDYALRDSRIKYFKTKKASGSPALPRNIGLDNAKGDYIAFLDADDLWLPEKLYKQLRFAEDNHYRLVYSYYKKMDWQGDLHDNEIHTRQFSTYDSLLKSNSIPCLTSFVYRETVGNTRFKNIPQEDFCFWLDILKKGVIAYNLCEVTALYRSANNSRSANKADMFKGYWNVIRNQQNIGLFRASLCMVTYTWLGVAKYLK